MPGSNVMDILDATIRAILDARARFIAQKGAGLAIVMHRTQHEELSGHPKIIEAVAPPPGLAPRLYELEGLPIYLFDGLVGPAIVDSRTLLMLKMLGAQAVR